MPHRLKKLRPSLVVADVSRSLALEKRWYGVTEFAFVDPDGYIITFAEIEP
jgi:hypothetical protein